MSTIQEKAAKLPKQFIKQLKRLCPSVFWVPNRAQARPLKHWMERPYPRVHIITFGNRTGKTEFLGQFLTGAARGKTISKEGVEICYVNPDSCYSPFFDDLEEKRLKGTLTIWWVCEADLMKKNGADYKIIASHMPDAKFKSRTNNGVYREIHVPVKGEGDKPYNLVISVKTHDQDTISFAGDNVDLIICDEPPPQKHWSEISGRMVTLAGEMGGRIIIGGTPLKMGAFLLDIIEEAEDEGDSRVVHDKGSIWENCAGEELPDHIAEKYNIPKNKETGIYETNGHLSCEGIENAIKNWEKSGDPDEIHARVDGEFTHAQGRIYKIFSKTIHVIEPYEIPDKYPIIMVVDPHDSRPDAAGWFAVTPTNKLICIAEYPEAPFENFTTRHEDILRTCESWRLIERDLKIQGRIYKRYADPNYMNDPDANTMKRKAELYEPHGFKFDLRVNDNLEYGHEKVRRMLWYDKVKHERFPGDPMYQPHLLFFSNCRNHIKFLRNYATKPIKDPSKDFNETPEQKWKHFADVIRYAAVSFKSYEMVKGDMEKSNSGSSEWEKIKQARHPFRGNVQGAGKYQNQRQYSNY